jgi:hypothetical protein
VIAVVPFLPDVHGETPVRCSFRRDPRLSVYKLDQNRAAPLASSNSGHEQRSTSGDESLSEREYVMEQDRLSSDKPLRYVMLRVKVPFGYRFESVFEEPIGRIQIGRLVHDAERSAIVKEMFRRFGTDINKGE